MSDVHPMERISLQMARSRAHEDGEYELDEWEGFTCPECGNRTLSAEVVFDDDEIPDDYDGGFANKCSECQFIGNLHLSDEDTDWSEVKEKIPEEYLSGETTEKDLPECRHCRRYILDDEEPVDISIGEREATVHEGCVDDIWSRGIENARWYDSFTDEHYWMAAGFLDTFDSVGHVLTSDFLRGMGEMYVHTNYATTEIVSDVIDEYDGRIVNAGIVRGDNEHEHSCTTDVHGTCFEILIDFCDHSGDRLPPEALYETYVEGDIKSADYFVQDQDKLFDADFSSYE